MPEETSTIKEYGRQADPTPEEIKERCLEIQAGWSDADRERRAIGIPKRQSWKVPTVKTSRGRK